MAWVAWMSWICPVVQRVAGVPAARAAGVGGGVGVRQDGGAEAVLVGRWRGWRGCHGYVLWFSGGRVFRQRALPGSVAGCAGPATRRARAGSAAHTHATRPARA